MSVWTLLAWVLVLEGALPLLAPAVWRRVVRELQALRDGQLRFYGLCAVLTGLAILTVGSWAS